MAAGSEPGVAAEEEPERFEPARDLRGAGIMEMRGVYVQGMRAGSHTGFEQAGRKGEGPMQERDAVRGVHGTGKRAIGEENWT